MMQVSAKALPGPRIGVRPVPGYKFSISTLYNLIDAQIMFIE